MEGRETPAARLAGWAESHAVVLMRGKGGADCEIVEVYGERSGEMRSGVSGGREGFFL